MTVLGRAQPRRRGTVMQLIDFQDTADAFISTQNPSLYTIVRAAKFIFLFSFSCYFTVFGKIAFELFALRIVIIYFASGSHQRGLFFTVSSIIFMYLLNIFASAETDGLHRTLGSRKFYFFAFEFEFQSDSFRNLNANKNK